MQYVAQEQQHDGEIVGLHSSDNGRSCNQHVCCRRHAVPGHIVRFKTEVMEVLYQVPGDPEPDARIETVIKAVLVVPLSFVPSAFYLGMWLQDPRKPPTSPTSLLKSLSSMMRLLWGG
jgi:hypothetical protein